MKNGKKRGHRFTNMNTQPYTDSKNRKRSSLVVSCMFFNSSAEIRSLIMEWISRTKRISIFEGIMLFTSLKAFLVINARLVRQAYGASLFKKYARAL